MRKPILLLAGLALATGACSGTSSTPYAPNPAPPDHHYATAAPYEPEPLPTATPYDGVTFEDPGVNPPVRAERDRISTFGLDVDTAAYSIARRYVGDGNLPDPASVRVEEFVNAFDQDYAVPEEGVFAISADGGPSPFLAGGRGPVPGRRPGEAGLPPGAPGRVADVRHRHLGLDGPRGPARAGQAVARLPRRPAPLARHRRDRRVRLGRAGRAGAHPGHRGGPDLRGHRLAARPAARPTPRPACGSATRWPPSRLSRGRHQPRDPRLGRRRERRRGRPGDDPRAGSAPTRRTGSSS